MATCSQCGISEAKIGLLCPTCVAQNKSRKVEAQAMYTSSATPSANSASMSPGLQVTAYIAVGVIVSFMLLRALGIFGYGTLPMLKAAGGYLTQDACAGKSRCLVVVMAPWCPACKASIPFLRSVSSYASTNSEIGIQVFVGLDEESKLRDMAGQINLNALIDPADTIYSALGGGGVPRWGVIDSERNIINRGGGLAAGLTEAHPQFVEYLRTQLGLL